MVEDSDGSSKDKTRNNNGNLKGASIKGDKSNAFFWPWRYPGKVLRDSRQRWEMICSLLWDYSSNILGEKLSDFLRRLDHCLSKIVQRGGFQASSMDRAWIEQQLKRCNKCWPDVISTVIERKKGQFSNLPWTTEWNMHLREMCSF